MFPKKIRTVDDDLRESYRAKHCVACGKHGAEGHHLITRKAGGPDEEWNLMPLCRICHAHVHSSGLSKFAFKCPEVENWLLSHGWVLSLARNKWIKENK